MSVEVEAEFQAKSRVRQRIIEDAQPSQPFFILNALAAIVASYGLLSNSTAVVIGAMIIAMLLGPILGIALGLVDGDTRLLRIGFTAEVAGAGLVMVTGLVIGLAHRSMPLTGEILARTAPNIMDMIVALAGGAAGAYATVSQRVSVGLIGVAISTALVPPLCVVGLCFASGYVHLAGGAFLLFLTNLVAIQCASSVVLFVFGYHKVTDRGNDDPAFKKRLLFDGLIFLVLAGFLTIQFQKVVDKRRFESQVEASLARSLTKSPGAYLTAVRYADGMSAQTIVAVVTTPNSISPVRTAEIESILRRETGRDIDLHIRSVLTKETVSAGYLHEIETNSSPIESRRPQNIGPSEVDRN